MVATSESVACHGELRVRTYAIDDLDALCPEWRLYDDETRLKLVRGLVPTSDNVTTNTTCVGLHEWLVDCLNTSTGEPPEPSVIAVGKSNTTPDSSDTTLNDEVDRIDITEYADEGGQVRYTAFVGELEGNVDTGAGETLSEAGVYADTRLFNHSLLPTEYEKDDTKTMTIEVVLSFSAA